MKSWVECAAHPALAFAHAEVNFGFNINRLNTRYLPPGTTASLFTDYAFTYAGRTGGPIGEHKEQLHLCHSEHKPPEVPLGDVMGDEDADDEDVGADEPAKCAPGYF